MIPRLLRQKTRLVHAEARVLLLVEVDAEVETVHLLDPKRKFTGGIHTHKNAQTAPRRAARHWLRVASAVLKFARPVCRLEERGEFAFADVRGTAVLLLSPSLYWRG